MTNDGRDLSASRAARPELNYCTACLNERIWEYREQILAMFADAVLRRWA